jgi:hypothetical protein
MKSWRIYLSICLLVALCGIAFHQLEYYNFHYGPRLASPGFVERILETEDRWDVFNGTNIEMGYVYQYGHLEKIIGLMLYTPLCKSGPSVSISIIPLGGDLYEVLVQEDERTEVPREERTLFRWKLKEISRTIMYNARGEDIEPIIDKYFFPNPLTRAYEKAMLIKSIERSRVSVFLADHGLWDLIWVMMDRIRSE